MDASDVGIRWGQCVPTPDPFARCRLRARAGPSTLQRLGLSPPPIARRARCPRQAGLVAVEVARQR